MTTHYLESALRLLQQHHHPEQARWMMLSLLYEEFCRDAHRITPPQWQIIQAILRDIVQHPTSSDRMRWLAACHLGQFYQDTRVEDYLTNILKHRDSSPIMVYHACFALAKTGSVRAVPCLHQRLYDHRPTGRGGVQVRDAARLALEAIGTDEAIRALNQSA